MLPIRLGVSVPFFGALTPDEFTTAVRELETRGYDTAWIGEAAGADAVTIMALMASATTRLRVASGVLPVQTRTPTVLGQTAATLARVAPGRVALGLGLSSPVVVGDWNGVAYSPALGQLREAITIIRAVTSGERVTFEGKFYRVKNFRLMLPAPAAPVKIYLAALGPRALELAGEIADGVLMNWIAPQTVPASIAHLEAGARRAGRTLDDFEIAAFVRSCVTDDPERARQTLARDIMGYVTVDSYAAFFRASGYAAEVDAARAAWKAGDRAGAVGHLQGRMVEGLGVVGPADACRARMADFSRSGLTMPVVVPFAPEGRDARPPEGRGARPPDAGTGDARASLLGTVRTFPERVPEPRPGSPGARASAGGPGEGEGGVAPFGQSTGPVEAPHEIK